MDHVFSPSFELAKYRTHSPIEKLGHCDIALRLFFDGRCDGPARSQGVAGIDQPAFDTAERWCVAQDDEQRAGLRPCSVQ
jgi:hypothetical protein